MKRGYSIRRLAWAGPAATLAAILVNSIYFTLTKVLGEPYLIPIDGAGRQIIPMPPLFFILPTLVVGLLAMIFFGLLIRFSRVPAIVFLSVAVAALILSLGGPSNLPNTPLKTELLLSGMNLLTAVILTGGILLLCRNNSKVP